MSKQLEEQRSLQHHLPEATLLISKGSEPSSTSPLFRVSRLVAVLVRHVARYTSLPERELIRFIKFAMVGTVGTVVDFSLLNFFHFVVGWPKYLANTASFSIAVWNNFMLNRHWTFPESKTRPIYTQMPTFFAVYVVGYFINQTVFLGSDAYLFSALFPPAISVNLAKALASLIGLFWNFGANRISTYRGL